MAYNPVDSSSSVSLSPAASEAGDIIVGQAENAYNQPRAAAAASSNGSPAAAELPIRVLHTQDGTGYSQPANTVTLVDPSTLPGTVLEEDPYRISPLTPSQGSAPGSPAQIRPAPRPTNMMYTGVGRVPGMTREQVYATRSNIAETRLDAQPAVVVNPAQNAVYSIPQDTDVDDPTDPGYSAVQGASGVAPSRAPSRAKLTLADATGAAASATDDPWDEIEVAPRAGGNTPQGRRPLANAHYARPPKKTAVATHFVRPAVAQNHFAKHWGKYTALVAAIATIGAVIAVVNSGSSSHNEPATGSSGLDTSTAAPGTFGSSSSSAPTSAPTLPPTTTTTVKPTIIPTIQTSAGSGSTVTTTAIPTTHTVSTVTSTTSTTATPASATTFATTTKTTTTFLVQSSTTGSTTGITLTTSTPMSTSMQSTLASTASVSMSTLTSTRTTTTGRITNPTQPKRRAVMSDTEAALCTKPILDAVYQFNTYSSVKLTTEQANTFANLICSNIHNGEATMAALENAYATFLGLNSALATKMTQIVNPVGRFWSKAARATATGNFTAGDLLRKVSLKAMKRQSFDNHETYGMATTPVAAQTRAPAPQPTSPAASLAMGSAQVVVQHANGATSVRPARARHAGAQYGHQPHFTNNPKGNPRGGRGGKY